MIRFLLYFSRNDRLKICSSWIWKTSIPLIKESKRWNLIGDFDLEYDLESSVYSWEKSEYRIFSENVVFFTCFPSLFKFGAHFHWKTNTNFKTVTKQMKREIFGKI